MPKHSILTQKEEQTEQEQRAIAVTAGGAARHHTWRNVRLIIGREYRNRLTQRSFIISSIVLMLLVAIAAFIPTIVQIIASHSNSQTKVVVVNNAGPVAGLNNDCAGSDDQHATEWDGKFSEQHEYDGAERFEKASICHQC